MAAEVGNMSAPKAQNAIMQSFLTSGPGAIRSIVTGVDEDGARRKRRKTDSPENDRGDRKKISPATRESHPRIIKGSGPSPPCDITPQTNGTSSQTPTSAIQIDDANTIPSITGIDDPDSSKTIAFENDTMGNTESPSQRVEQRRKRKPPEKISESIAADTVKSADIPSQHHGVARGVTPAGLGTALADAGAQEGPKDVTEIRLDDNLSFPKAQHGEGEVVAQILPDTAHPTTSALKSSTSLKKLMKVRSDGRLASPKGQTNAERALKNRRGRPKKSANAVKEGLLVIKYGMSKASRVTLGQRIQEIFSRPRTSLVLEAVSTPASRSPEPLKATHPFFLGKVIRKPQVHAVDGEQHERMDRTNDMADGSECNLSPAKRKSPRKAVASVNGGFFARLKGLGPDSVVFGGSGPRRYPGALEPIWPPKDMIHVRPDFEGFSKLPLHVEGPKLRPSEYSPVTKLKGVATKVLEDEEVLYGYTTIVKACSAMYSETKQLDSQCELLRVPIRKVTDGKELQDFCHKKKIVQMLADQPSCRLEVDVDESSGDLNSVTYTHPALSHLFHDIRKCRTAFDRFECETSDWIHKYAPKKAEEVLQAGQEALILRDWLRSLAVNVVDPGNKAVGTIQDPMRTLKKSSAGATRRKRKRAEALDGFVVSSDEEADAMGELTKDIGADLSEQPEDRSTKRTVIRTREAATLADDTRGRERSSNAVVVSGPSGCGKTAAVYAAAQELGFEVFEINAGSRRSGKDILDKVGDMSQNHLVNRSRPDTTGLTNSPDDDLPQDDDALKRDIETGRQGTMNAFLQAPQHKKKISMKDKHPKGAPVIKTIPKPKTQKQSVILFEEADVLFEEDKQFWATTMELIMHSRRPVVMTCTDERLLPLDDLPLFGILRFQQPPTELATEYLRLLTCSEGHIVSGEAVSALYKVKHNDLRASITELQFFCQMAIGDTKGGLEWMLIQPHKENKQNSVAQRVVSGGTYERGMGWVEHSKRFTNYDLEASDEIDVVMAVCSTWGIDLAAEDGFFLAETEPTVLSTTCAENLKHLKSLDLVYDALSAADTFPCPSFHTGLGSLIDTTTPEISGQDHANYTEGLTLLQADLLVDHSGVSGLIAAGLRVFARRVVLEANGPYGIESLNEQHLIDVLPEIVQAQRCPKPVTPQALSTAFMPISKPSIGSFANRGPLISCLDGPNSIVTEDVAPYVRAVVAHDLRLEEQRRQLQLASQNGRDGKRARTTRASRAALEGGSKANKRRERWFPTNTDFEFILATGGKAWQDQLLRPSTVEGGDIGTDIGASRRSSTASIDKKASEA
ncbi:MAG: hypothetical protein Q9170_003194 [Blastenia crenularia]